MHLSFHLDPVITQYSVLACIIYTVTILSCMVYYNDVKTASEYMDHHPFLQIIFIIVLILTSTASAAKLCTREDTCWIHLFFLLTSVWYTFQSIVIPISDFQYAHLLSIGVGSLFMYFLTFLLHSYNSAFFMTMDLLYLVFFQNFAIAEFIFFELVILRVIFSNYHCRSKSMVITVIDDTN